jgi:hypothetical protein
MVLQTAASPEVESCRFLLQGQVKNLADRLYGPTGPGFGTPFAEIERVVLKVGLDFQKQLCDLLLARQAEAMHQNLPEQFRCCPSCKRDTIAQEPEPRLLHSRAGVVEWQEPHRYCKRCRKAFFPQSQMLGIDLGHYSNSLLELISYAGANKLSFREASFDLEKMGGHRVNEKQVERLTKRIGLERLAERDAEVKHYADLPLAKRCEEMPHGVAELEENQVAVIMVDAGMLQLRDVSETADDTEEPPADLEETEDVKADSEEEEDDDGDKPSGRHWHENKVGLAMVMHSQVSESDPHPEIPTTFLNIEHVSKIVRGLKKSAALRAEEEAESRCEDQSTEQAEDAREKAAYEGPKLEKRRAVASRKSWPMFGVLMACTAWLFGFAKAKRKAFVADGARSIWGVWKSRFSSYVPILDFIHALSYVYSAAKAAGGDNAIEGARLYVEWITWVWQGNVAAVIERLEQLQNERVPSRPAPNLCGFLEFLRRTAYMTPRLVGLWQGSRSLV